MRNAARRQEMRTGYIALVAAMAAVMALSSCANTIRGFGKDASNTKDAVKHATN
jgi:predicted small secreted protein